MARDSRNALVALNRFGFGARGGASGDFVNAASDPRGFVKADLGRVNAALLEVPGLQPTPDLARAVFEFQFEQKQAREAAKSATTGPRLKLRRRQRPMRSNAAASRSPTSRRTFRQRISRFSLRPIARRHRR